MKEKWKEAVMAVAPITIIVTILCFTVTPFPTHAFSLFLVGAILLIIGMGLFTIGAEASMGVIGERVGAHLTKSKNIWLIILIAVLLGTIATVAEPDLQVLATQIPSIDNYLLIGVVSIGVGVFLALALLRIIFNIRLSYVFIFFYTIMFLIAIFVPEEFWSVAFDAGGVTTGAITVPLILALGVGATAIRENKESESDSFGIMALCSIGPALTILILGLFYPLGNATYQVISMKEYQNIWEILIGFWEALPLYMKEVGISMLPITLFFIIYQIVALRLSKKELIRIGVGLLYTFLGISIFLTGVNVGFMPIGTYIGRELTNSNSSEIVILIAMLIGYFLVRVEPAVVVLNKQVSDITDGAIPEKMMRITLSIGVAIAVAIAMIRVYTGISIMWILLPAYLFAILLTFFVPDIFTAIAFDSGGIASGTMTASFLLPFAIGVSEVMGGNVLTDAFGFIGIVSTIPIICIQVLGLVYKIKINKSKNTRKEKMATEEIIDLS